MVQVSVMIKLDQPTPGRVMASLDGHDGALYLGAHVQQALADNGVIRHNLWLQGLAR